jgi:hypothetical protein
MLLNNKKFNLKKFNKFLELHRLCILDLNLNRINIKNILYRFSKLEKKRNTIGDYILIKNSFNNNIKNLKNNNGS